MHREGPIVNTVRTETSNSSRGIIRRSKQPKRNKNKENSVCCTDFVQQCPN